MPLQSRYEPWKWEGLMSDITLLKSFEAKSSDSNEASQGLFATLHRNAYLTFRNTHFNIII